MKQVSSRSFCNKLLFSQIFINMSIKIVQTGQGKSTSLPCIASTSLLNNPSEVYVFEWTKNGQVIYSGSNDGEDEGYPAHKYKGRLKHTVHGALNFKNVIPDDQGDYLCTVKYMNKPARISDSSVVQLVVNRGPKVTMMPSVGSTVFRKQRQQVKLECATSDDNAEIEWLKNRQPLRNLIESDRLQFHNKNQVLILKELQQSDSGHYGCLAANVFGETYQHINLVLPVDVHFKEQLKNQTAQIGRLSIWHCRAFGQPENITYEWLFNDQKLPFANGLALRSTQINGTLSIKPVTKEDSGKFTCSASNGYGKAASSAFLDVQYHPLVVISSTPSVQYLGENLTTARINCYFDANPALFNVRWSKEGRTLSATKHRFMHFSSSTIGGRLFHAWLEFRQVHPKDAGQYSCQAYNSAGASDIFEIYAVIAKPPHFTRIPPQSIFKRQGDTLEVTCDGESPEQKSANAHRVKIYWKKKPTVMDGSTDMVFQGKTLKIRSISYKDHGCYNCLVENEVASLTSEMCLIVNDTPPQPPVNASVQSSCCDSTVSWNPGHNGGYRQWFIVKYREKSPSSSPWHVANMTANSSSTRFTATNLIPGTTYEYVIQPYNAVGQGYAIHVTSKTKSKKGKVVQKTAQLKSLLYLSQSRCSERNKKAVEKQPQSSSHKFEPLMNDISQKNVDIRPEQPPVLVAGSTYDFRVRSKIPNTGWLSEPSNIVKYHLPDFSDQESTVLAAVGGSSVIFVISLLVIAVLFAATRHKNVKRHDRTPSFRHGVNGTACENNHTSHSPHEEQLKYCSNIGNGYLLHHNKISDVPSKQDLGRSPSDSFLLIGEVPDSESFTNIFKPEDNRSEFDVDQEKGRNSFFPEFESNSLAMFPYSRESRV